MARLDLEDSRRRILGPVTLGVNAAALAAGFVSEPSCITTQGHPQSPICLAKPHISPHVLVFTLGVIATVLAC